MRKIYISSVLLFLAALAGCTVRRAPQPVTVTLGGHTVAVSVADEPTEQQQGLAGVESLSWDTGMLFAFDQPAPRVFWMKGMRIPIDIIWIRGSRVVGIEPEVAPPNEDSGPVDDAKLPLYTSPEPVEYVLEVRSGFAGKYGLSAGDSVTIRGLLNR